VKYLELKINPNIGHPNKMSKSLEPHSPHFLHLYYSENFQFKEKKPEIFAVLLRNGNVIAHCLIYRVTGSMYPFILHNIDIDKNST